MMKNRPSILLPIVTGFAVMFIVMLILLVAGFGQPGGVAQWLGLSPWLGHPGSEPPVGGMPLPQVIAIVDLFVALLAIAITTQLTRTRETALVLKVEQAEGTLDALAQAVIRLDAAGRITYLNPAASRLLGEETGLLPAQIDLIDHHSRRPLLPSLLANESQNDLAPLPSGTRLISRQGVELEVEGSCRTIRNAQGGIEVAVLLLSDVTEEREWARRQPDLWDRDALTTLPGHSFMVSRLARILERVRAGERPIAYIQVTLDGIQRVYQEAGVRAGDTLVRHMTGLLRSHIRDTDLLARMDEQVFGTLLTVCPREIADRIMTDILATLSSSHFNWEGRTFDIHARLGCVHIPPFEGTVEELFSAVAAHD
jgi:diguanylate cyclase (GGDEF)-like protein/PAS domain S-box-containing protein